jgi:polar amino acid transport system substrate-binding protein
MKRLLIATAALALAAAALAAWGFAAPFGSTGRAGARTIAEQYKFPPLPADVQSRHRWVIGVKCDFPPFGYIDVKGQNGGYDVEIARRFAQIAFGKINRVSLVCVTTPSRIPALQSKRVDIIISTLTYTKARDEVIDYSIPYYAATGRLLVNNDSPIVTIRDIANRTVVTTRGALYASWIRNCFKSTNLLEVDSPASAVLAVKSKQADAFMFDDAFLVGVATQDRDVKLTFSKFLAIPWGIGIRQGDTATANWVNAALRFMKARDEFVKILKNNVPPKLFSDFSENVPRPNQSFSYPQQDLTAICP